MSTSGLISCSRKDTKLQWLLNPRLRKTGKCLLLLLSLVAPTKAPIMALTKVGTTALEAQEDPTDAEKA
jgi:hypothetical protein